MEVEVELVETELEVLDVLVDNDVLEDVLLVLTLVLLVEVDREVDVLDEVDEVDVEVLDVLVDELVEVVVTSLWAV